jgi:hypothetical protein
VFESTIDRNLLCALARCNKSVAEAMIFNLFAPHLVNLAVFVFVFGKSWVDESLQYALAMIKAATARGHGYEVCAAKRMVTWQKAQPMRFFPRRRCAYGP